MPVVVATTLQTGQVEEEVDMPVMAGLTSQVLTAAPDKTALLTQTATIA